MNVCPLVGLVAGGRDSVTSPNVDGIDTGERMRVLVSLLKSFRGRKETEQNSGAQPRE